LVVTSWQYWQVRELSCEIRRSLNSFSPSATLSGSSAGGLGIGVIGSPRSGKGGGGDCDGAGVTSTQHNSTAQMAITPPR
jgi:hypothetical protein